MYSTQKEQQQQQKIHLSGRRKEKTQILAGHLEVINALK